MKINNTIMEQLLQILLKYEFNKAVKTYQADKHTKGFSCWSHFVSLLFGQLSGYDSLHSITRNLATLKNSLYHLGLKLVKRSTLSYVNNKRNTLVCQDLFFSLLSKIKAKAPHHMFRFKNKLYNIDSTTVDFCLSVYKWAKFRRTKGGFKLRTKLNHSGYLPEIINVSNTVDNDQRHAHRFTFEKGDIVLFNRGFDNYEQYASYCEEKIYFVTRMKDNAAHKVLERKNVSKYKHISSDHRITFTGYYSKKKCPLKLRRIRSIDPETGKAIIILTNIFHLSVQTIADLYKERWKIEIFFKNIKQHLKIKSFIGTSRNAVLSQIWVTMIAYLLLSYLKFLSTYKWTIRGISVIVSKILFLKKVLWVWLNKPFEPIEINQFDSLQLELL